MPCPVCKTGTATGLHLIPLCFRDLERTIELRRSSASSQSKTGGSIDQSKKNDKQEIHAEATYLLLSNNRSALASSGLSDREQQRTGRWTDEEIAFVDYLVAAFDQGKLPLPHGVKLNEFLGDMLMCKSSRLTKKMKNAKLSTRSFELGKPQSMFPRNDYPVLSGLQEKFLMSIPSEPIQLELRFNITKQWRTHFSNLCVQIGYPSLDGKEWVASLEEMERRASNAEETIRKVRRRRMGLALQTDSGSGANPNVYIGGVKADDAPGAVQSVLSADRPLEVSSNSQIRKLSTSDDGSNDPSTNNDMFDMLAFNTNDKANPSELRPRSFSEEFLSGQAPIQVESDEGGRARTFSEDFDDVLNDLMDSEAAAGPGAVQAPVSEAQKTTGRSDITSSSSRTCSPFLDAIISYVESKNIAFQHADVWVPSFLPRETDGPSKAVDTEQLRLFHAGHATRGDLDHSLACSLNEFGVYSDKFSFEPGHGLPGRVYSSGKVIWESSVDESDPKKFERAGGAKVYGIKTAVGIPLNTPLVGRIVVAIYSCQSLNEDMSLAADCASELAKYSPEPKWKLVIEMNSSDIAKDSKSASESNHKNGRRPPALQLPQPADQGTTQLGGCTSPTAANSDNLIPDPEEQRIVTLLGDHMPVSDSSAGEPSSSNANSSNLLPHFMSIRLLLLRPASRRTVQEIEMIDILKSSFRAYSKDNRRGGAELANLLARDWVCLKGTFSAPNANSSNAPAATKRTSSLPAQQQPVKADSNKRQRTSPLAMPANMPTSAPTNSFSGPMKAPSQFMRRSASIGFMPAPAPMGMPSIQQNNNGNVSTRRNSSFAVGAYNRPTINTQPANLPLPMNNQQLIAPKANLQLDLSPQMTPQQIKSVAPSNGMTMQINVST